MFQNFPLTQLVLVEETFHEMHLWNQFTKELVLDGVQVEGNQKGLITRRSMKGCRRFLLFPNNLMIMEVLIINNNVRMCLLVEDEVGLVRIRTMCMHGSVFLLIPTAHLGLNGVIQTIEIVGNLVERKISQKTTFCFVKCFLLNDRVKVKTVGFIAFGGWNDHFGIGLYNITYHLLVLC